MHSTHTQFTLGLHIWDFAQGMCIKHLMYQNKEMHAYR